MGHIRLQRSSIQPSLYLVQAADITDDDLHRSYCTHNNEPAIVLCHDWRSEVGDVAGGKVTDKLDWIIPGEWALLLAGPLMDATRMANVFRAEFGRCGVIANSSISSLMDASFRRYKWELADGYLSVSLGLNYEDLVPGIPFDSGERKEFRDEFVEQKLAEIEQLPIPNCQLIVAGFTQEKKPIVCVVNEPMQSHSDSPVRFDTNFAAIGSGFPAAMISLYKREHMAPECQLMKAAYHVF